MSYLAKAGRAARARKDIERARNRRRRQTQRRNQRARAAAAPAVVVQVPGLGKGAAGQRQGRILLGRSERWIMESHVRLALERRLAEERAREATT